MTERTGIHNPKWWMGLAVVVLGALAAVFVENDWAKVGGLIAAGLTAGGYVVRKMPPGACPCVLALLLPLGALGCVETPQGLRIDATFAEIAKAEADAEVGAIEDPEDRAKAERAVRILWAVIQPWIVTPTNNHAAGPSHPPSS